MNINAPSDYDVAPLLMAKTCRSSYNNAKVVYSFADDTNQILFVDKRKHYQKPA
jgi:hypothetical protein